MRDTQIVAPDRRYRGGDDMAIAMLSDELVAVTAVLHETETDRDVYRTLAKEAIHALAKVTRQRDRAREAIRHMMGRQDDDDDVVDSVDDQHDVNHPLRRAS
jgi:hypothetical protein